MTEVMGEVVEEHETYLPAVREQSPTLFGTTNPAEVIERATEAARPLAEVVRKQKLTTSISGREHVRVEGWTLLGSMLGVFPVCVWTRKFEDGWEARVEARTRDGAVVGAAEAECLRSESLWKSRDDYALRSMAQTRATSKALRQPLGFVMQLAGFEPTPAEEMPQPERAKKGKEPSKSERMRDRLRVLGLDADQIRGVEAGTSLSEIEAKLDDAWDEDTLARVGIEVSDWLREGCKQPFTDYVPVKF